MDSSASNHVTGLERGSDSGWWRHTDGKGNSSSTSGGGPWGDSYDETVTEPGFYEGAYYGTDYGVGREEYFAYLGDAFSNPDGPSSGGMFWFAYGAAQSLRGQGEGGTGTAAQGTVGSASDISRSVEVVDPSGVAAERVATPDDRNAQNGESVILQPQAARTGGDANLYRYCSNNPITAKNPYGREQWQLHLSGHGGPHIQLGHYRWDAITLKPVKQGKITPPPLTEAQLRELAKSGILQRIAKNVPESIVRAAAKEVAEEAARKGGKAAWKQLAKAVLKRMPVVVIIFAAQDYLEGGWEKAAKNVVIPGDLIEAVAAQAGDLYDQWFAQQAARLNQRRFGMIKGWLPEVP